MLVATEAYNELTCEISSVDDDEVLVGIVNYKGFKVGTINDRTLDGISSQFRMIKRMFDEGAMFRRGVIMLGYHNEDLKGDVLLFDGEVIGSWFMDDDEWSYFKLEGSVENTCGAPSPWMLQDSIADLLERREAK